MINYRHDIDGFRALAVISVMFFHFGNILPGGFIGVDIFFVISGFLITSIIYKNLKEGNFLFLEFYKRRIKRIIPALYLVLFFTILAAYFLMPPYELYKMSGSIVSVIFNISNIYFWKTANYFDVSTDYKPLLHTWSLGVEEQFYIFFPLLMWILYRIYKNNIPLVIGILCVLSFVLSIYLQNDMPSANFYLLPMRAWQMGAGALLAVTVNSINLKRFSLLLSTIGIILIIIPILTYDKHIIFPGISALPAVMGTILLIASGSDNIVNKFFSNYIFTWIGRISYSLYLWHWPIYVFCLLTIGKSPFSYLTMWILSFIFAGISYYFFENLLRNIKDKLHEKILLYSILIFSVFGVLLSYYIYSSKGFLNRFSSHAKGAFTGQFDYDKDMQGCLETPSVVMNKDHCLLGNGEGKPILLWGDSHGRSILTGLLKAVKIHNKSLLVRNVGGCSTLTDKLYIERKICQNYSFEMLKLIKQGNFEKVILAGRWSIHHDGEEFGRKLKYYDKNGNRVSDENIKRKFEKSFEDLLSIIASTGAEIYIIDTVPSHNVHIPELILRDELIGRYRTNQLKTDILDYDNYISNTEPFRDFIKNINIPNLYLIEVGDVFCQKGKNCSYADDNGIAYYRDTNHLSEYGSLKLSNRFKYIFSSTYQNN